MTTKELVGASKSVEEIRQSIGADTLAYLSDEGLYAFEDRVEKKTSYCDACFTNRYPVSVDEDAETRQLGLFDAAAIRTP